MLLARYQDREPARRWMAIMRGEIDKINSFKPRKALDAIHLAVFKAGR